MLLLFAFSSRKDGLYLQVKIPGFWEGNALASSGKEVERTL